MIPVIGLTAFAGEYEVGFSDAPALMRSVTEQLTCNGFNFVAPNDILYNGATVSKAVEALKYKDFDIICACICTWSEDHHLLDLLDHFDKPVILWAFPAVHTGSLAGVQQICCVLKELGRQYFYVYGHPGDRQVLEEISRISRTVALQNRLKHVKIGSIGGRVKGMTSTTFDEHELKNKTGVRVVNLDDDDLINEYNTITESCAAEYWENLKPKAGKVTCTDKHGVEAVRYYLALGNLVKNYDLSGIAIKCYPRFMGKICLGYSILSEEGIVCACEGDVNNTVVMKILYELTGTPTHNTDLLHPDLDTNSILFSHCGSGGFSIADCRENIHLGPVRLAETGVAAMFPAKPGRVTLACLVGRKGTLRMSAIVGDALSCGMEFPGNPLKVRFDKDILELNREIAQEGVGHHWIGGYGDVSMELEDFCRLREIRYIRF